MHNYVAPMVMKNFSLKQKENEHNKQIQLLKAIKDENEVLIYQLLEQDVKKCM